MAEVSAICVNSSTTFARSRRDVSNRFPSFSPTRISSTPLTICAIPFKLVDFRRPELDEDTLASLTSGLRPDRDRTKEPLEDFPIDTLRLKGTIDDKEGIKWGLIFAPDNTIHRVIEGNYMGQNHGRIILVSDQTIELTEIVPDGLGNYIERSSAVTLIE